MEVLGDQGATVKVFFRTRSLSSASLTSKICDVCVTSLSYNKAHGAFGDRLELLGCELLQEHQVIDEPRVKGWETHREPDRGHDWIGLL